MNVAWDREETDSCQRGTTGCCVDHEDDGFVYWPMHPVWLLTIFPLGGAIMLVSWLLTR